jgi:putative ABC transport system permease protein
MIKDYFRLAYRNTKKRKVRSWLTMLGIFVGIAAVVALISLSQGLKGAVAQQFANLGSDKLIVQAAGGGFGPPGSDVPEPLTQDLKEVIEKVQGVDIVVGRLVRPVRIDYNDEQKYSFAVTIPEDQEEKDLIIEVNNYELIEGKFFDNDDSREVVIGDNIAQDLFEKKIELRNKIKLQGVQFKVVGLLKKSGNPQQDNSLIVPEGSLKTILKLKDEYDIIPVKVKAEEDLALVAERIEKTLRKERGVDEGKEDFNVQSPDQIIGTLNNILLVIQGVLVGIASIALIVGGIGIMNTMYTSVLERTKEIGVMKAVGATNKRILALFLIESGFLGFFGGVIGVALGLGISKLVEAIAFAQFGESLIKADVSMTLLFSALFFAFVVGAMSGAFPAMQASKLKPVEALRK